MDARIEYRESGSFPWELWARREGSREEIIYSAESLLKEIRSESPASKVRVVLQNNHIINIRHRKNIKPPKKDNEDSILSDLDCV